MMESVVSPVNYTHTCVHSPFEPVLPSTLTLASCLHVTAVGDGGNLAVSPILDTLNESVCVFVYTYMRLEQEYLSTF